MQLSLLQSLPLFTAFEQPNVCPQPLKLTPPASSDHFFSASYRKHSIDLLAGAVQIRTESFDDMDADPLRDSRFDGLYHLHDYLATSFPLAAKHGHLEFINTFGMLYTFEGAKDLKPLLFTGHLDTVPVNNQTLDQWEFDPFSGHYDGQYLHGRGSVDCKNTVVAILEAIEHLLSTGWKPTRTILVGYGFDEEIGGPRGAGHISQELLRRYGPDSLEFVLDEASGQAEIDGVRILGPQVAERGAINTRLTVLTPGGHSSMPPDHTGIGILSRIITELEANAFAPGIKDWAHHPAAALYQCIAKHTEAFPKGFAKKVLNLDKSANLQALVDYIQQRTNWMVWTSQAVDTIYGGVKVNALPEKVEAVTNYRVSIDSSPKDVYKHVESIVGEVSKTFNLSFYSGDKQLATGSQGSVTLASITETAVAPISPWTGKPWDIITGTIRHVFEDIVGDDTPAVIAPAIVSGNTDTAYYWDLSDYVYRYSPYNIKDVAGKHTVGEKIKFDAHLGSIAFFHETILNYDHHGSIIE